MTKIDIFSGFLGAGKTTLIKKLIQEAYTNEKVVLIENEFGQIGIDGGFLKDAGINITEMNSGCICCSLVGDFAKALKKVSFEYHPDRIIIEPSGVGKLSDVIKAVENAHLEDAVLNSFCTVVDANKCKLYMKNFGEFFNNQVEAASCIILSHTKNIDANKLSTAVSLLREHNSNATLVTTDWESLSGKDILKAMENKDTLAFEMNKLKNEQEECHEHHHHDDDDECCGHHHDDDDECCGHHHHDHDDECCGHHHDDDDECCGHHHDDEDDECCEHHHDDDDDECCGRHHDDDDDECHEHHHDDDDNECHEHHHHHHADEIFTSFGLETTKKYTVEEMKNILSELSNEEKYGTILRAKGIVDSTDKEWIHFDYVPNEPDIRHGSAGVIGRFCVIGCKINKEELKNLFKI